MLHKAHHLEAISTTTMFNLDLCQIRLFVMAETPFIGEILKKARISTYFIERGEIMCTKVIFENYQAWQTFVRNDYIRIAT